MAELSRLIASSSCSEQSLPFVTLDDNTAQTRRQLQSLNHDTFLNLNRVTRLDIAECTFHLGVGLDPEDHVILQHLNPTFPSVCYSATLNSASLRWRSAQDFAALWQARLR